MLDKFIFENHLGQRFNGFENGVYLNYNELRDYSWKYDTMNNRISRFYRPITERKLPLVVCCISEADAAAVKNRLHNLAELDIEAKIPGKVFIGDYYTTGYITGCVKSQYLIEKRLCYLDLTLTSDDPAWYREQTYAFRAGGIDIPDDDPEDDPESGGIKPEGTLKITKNGSFDVTRYAIAVVDVPTGTGTTISSTHDGNGNVALIGVMATSLNGNVTIT